MKKATTTKKEESLATIRAQCRKDERGLAEALAAQVQSPQEAKQRTFRKNGKLLVLLEEALPEDEKIYPYLGARGFSKSTISNARAAASVFEMMVISGRIEESSYDQLTWRQLRQVKGVIQSGQRTPSEVAAIMADHPGDFADHLNIESKDPRAAGREGGSSTGLEEGVASSFDDLAARLEEVASLAGALSPHDQKRLAEQAFKLFQLLKRAELKAA